MKRILVFSLAFLLLLLNCSLSETVESNPVGRWTVASSYDELSSNYMFAKTDLFLFEDGNAFRLSVQKVRTENDLKLFYDNGLWMGNSEDLIIRVGKDMFTAYIDDGSLWVKKGENDPVQFIRVLYK